MPIRTDVPKLEAIPNVGPAIAGDLRLIGLTSPADLVGKDPYELFETLCAMTGTRHDPCVIDVFISAVRYMEGAEPRKWWEYTSERKAFLQGNDAK